MENERLKHDCALMAAEHCLDLVDNLLREEEKITAREEFYQVCKASLECYLVMADRLRQRLAPLDN